MSDDLCKDFLVKSRPAVMTMVKAFEMKKSADAHKRVQISKSGVLDTVKMMNYKWSEDVFRKTATVRDGKNHGLVMFLDWSGSMCDQIAETMEQLITLVLFCKKVNIPFEVYAFTSQDPSGFGNEVRDWEPGVENPNHYFSLLNLFSSRMKKHEFDAAIRNNYALALSQTYDRRVSPTAPRSSVSVVRPERSDSRCHQIVPVQEGQQCPDREHRLPHRWSERHERPNGGYLKIKGDRIGVKSDGNATNMLTKMLRERTGCNIVNFFLGNWVHKFLHAATTSRPSRIFRTDRRLGRTATTRSPTEIDRDGMSSTSSEP